MAEQFEKVITFEPDALNYKCLKMNCTEKNIEAFNAALGAKPGTASLDLEAETAAHTAYPIKRMQQRSSSFRPSTT
jgi:FkbM family methyltransferase